MKKFEPKKILVPVDFSDFSQEALKTAAEIAELAERESHRHACDGGAAVVRSL